MEFNNDLKERLKERLGEYLQNERILEKGNFSCLNPDHNDKHGSMSLKENYVKCFACDVVYDIFDVIRIRENKPTFKEQFDFACEYFGIIQDRYKSNSPKASKTPPKAPIKATKENKIITALKDLSPEEKANVNAYIKQAQNNINNKDGLDYLKSRGIENKELLNKYGIGYSLKNYKGDPFPSIIIPTSLDTESFTFTGLTGRQLKEGIGKDGKVYKANKGGKAGIFNLKALYQSDKPVFITEGEINALSIMEATHGEYEALAIGSSGNAETFIDLFELKRTKAFLILELDDDHDKEEKGEKNRGKEAQAKIEEYFKKAGISFLSADIIKNCRNHTPGKDRFTDQNDALKYTREFFIDEIETVLKQVETITKENNKMTTNTEPIKEINQSTTPTPEQKKEAPNSLVNLDFKSIENKLKSSRIDQSFIEKEIDFLEARSKRKYKKTGFYNLDQKLGGGLESGLYLIGAVPGMGKSAFYQQIAENLAEQGHNVLYFSLEMSRHVLLARTVSRRLKKDNFVDLSAKEILNFKEENRPLILDAYSKIYDKTEEKGNIYLIDNSKENESDAFISREHLSYYVEFAKTESTDEKGNKIYNYPVVIIDYVQILRRSEGENSLDKKSLLDKHMETLKALSSKYDIPVLVISSLNRDSYKDDSSKLTLASLKESGDIEYYAEVIFLLDYNRDQYKTKKGKGESSYTSFSIEEAKRISKDKGYSELNVIIAKDRNGVASNSPIYYYGKSTYFTEELIEDKPKKRK